MPNIGCPVLLLQADPAYGAAMTDDDVRRALPLLRRGTHMRMAGMSHVLHNSEKNRCSRPSANFYQPCRVKRMRQTDE